MGRLRKRLVGVVIVGALPLAATAQLPVNLNASPDQSVATNELGGTPCVDIITLKGVSPAAPLRFGGVVPGSETVTLGTRNLVAGQDYKLDGPAGVIYLAVAAKPGDMLTVSYRYKPNADAAAASRFMGVPTMKFNLLPGGMNMLLGFGQTERTADGRVLSSNMFGFDQNMKFAGGQLKGLFLYGQREKNDVQGGMNMNPLDKPGSSQADEGDSRLILQNYSTKMLGGQASFEYQDVSSNFSGYQAALDSGYDQAAVDKLQKERGLTRVGMAFKDLKFGSVGVSNSFRNIKDATGSIEWRNFGLQSGGLSLNYSGQKVDNTFQRFTDIAEADREQLMREKGLSRQNLVGQYVQKSGSLKFNTQSITDDLTNNSIEHRDISLDTSRIKFSLGDEKVSQGFTRFDSIMAPEKAQYGLGAGLKRQWMSLQATIFGGATPLNFSQSEISSSTGDYRAQDVSLGNKTWSLQHSERVADNGFNAISSMNRIDPATNTPEINKHIGAVANMYGPGTAWNPADGARLTIPTGISRVYTGFQTQLFKGWNFAISDLALKGAQGDGSVQTVGLTGKGFEVNFRKQELAKDFSEITQLMSFEQQRLGMISGLDRTDLLMNFNLGGSKNLKINNLQADVQGSAIKRTQIGYTDKRIDVSVNAREVDPTMTLANQLLDPEKDLLQSLTGFKEQDIRIKWQLLPELKADLFKYDANNNSTDEERSLRQVALDWTPNKNTYLGYFKMEQHADDPVSKLFANILERISLNKDFGRAGKLQFLDETAQYDGTTNTNPDYHKQYLSYEASVDKKTSVKTEQTRTSYDNGDKENVSANTVSTALSPKTGVSVTDVRIDRGGIDRDEVKRNYGFWYEIGNGLRLSYGYARHLNGQDGDYNSTFSVGPATAPTADKVNTVGQGRVGDLLLGGGYGVNSWDAANRTQSFGAMAFNTAKPIRLGFMKDVTFAFNYDAAADYSAWLRENRLVSFAGTLPGGYQIGYQYTSQMTATGDRGIDRSYKFATPAQTAKNWFGASVYYKARTLPMDQMVMIRDITVSMKPSPLFELNHHVRTNPEVPQGGVLLGSTTAADRSSEWNLTWNRSANQAWTGSWKEYINDSSHQLTRTGGLTLQFNQAKSTPLSVYYGVETLDGNVPRKVTQRYSLQYADQRVGKNQSLSLFMGNVSYDHYIDPYFDRNNLTVRLDYQMRF